MTHELCHHRLDTTEGRYAVEVWADGPKDGSPRVVTLYVSDTNETTYLDLTPSEARALAALLVVSAERQEKAT